MPRKHKKKNYKKRRILRYFLIIILVGILAGSYFIYPYLRDVVFLERTALPLDYIEYNIDAALYPELAENLNSDIAYLYDVTQQKVIYSKKSNEIAPPASMSKIMTVMLAIENLDLDQRVTVPADIFPYLNQQVASKAGFSAGESVTVRDLIFGALIPSGGDATMTIARAVAGSETAFAEMMTAKAKEIGMKNTSFAGSVGLDDVNTYSTAEDIAILMMYALNNETFVEFISTYNYTTSSTAYHSNGIKLSNKFYEFQVKQNNNNNAFEYTYIGGKTGYTQKAQHCLVSSFIYGDSQYVLVTMRGTGNATIKKYDSYDDAVMTYKIVSKIMKSQP